jgi:transposase
VEVEGSDLATELVGMAGLFVVKVLDEDGLWLLVETRPGLVACRSCGVRAESKGRSTVLVRDLEIAGRASVLVWRKRRWRCVDPDCEAKTWTEQIDTVVPRAGLTERAKAEIARRVGADAQAVSRVAAAFGIGWDTAWRAFEAHVTPMVDDPARIGGVEALGIDETAFLAATPTHSTLWATGLVDVRRGLLVDVIEGRSASILRSWLGRRPAEWLAGVEVVSIDPFEAYRSGLAPHLSHALIVADPFHIVRLANRAVDRVRRRTQADQLGHRGRRGDPLYDARKVLITGFERLNDRGWGRLNIALDAGDPRNEVLAAWLAKEHVREVYVTPEPTRADRVLGEVIDECAASGIAELGTLAKTLRRWRTEIINRHRTGDSNGPTEAMNLLIKNIKRAGCGYRNFHHYRLRLLAHCGIAWESRRVTRLRGRAPQLVA